MISLATKGLALVLGLISAGLLLIEALTLLGAAPLLGNPLTWTYPAAVCWIALRASHGRTVPWLFVAIVSLALMFHPFVAAVVSPRRSGLLLMDAAWYVYVAVGVSLLAITAGTKRSEEPNDRN